MAEAIGTRGALPNQTEFLATDLLLAMFWARPRSRNGSNPAQTSCI
jgi:hypothetical protein